MKKLLLAIVFFSSLNLVTSQSISFADMDGTTTEYNLTDVRKITFNSGNVSIYLNNDEIVTLPFDEFKNYQYSEETLSNEEVVKDSNAFRIYPNPTEGVFRIRLDAQSSLPYECTIYDVNGKAILQKDLGVLNGFYTEDISIEKFPSGMYFVELKSGHIKSSKQLIKQ
ncbi:T9SS type A sorting domain-containing protein [Winogradskyella sp.]|uniref:T9SS type A sorting domain-containing protein n=1 Tax=Winogradskyella sp. TaxID=1883156 RepID=UPI003BAAC71B